MDRREGSSGPGQCVSGRKQSGERKIPPLSPLQFIACQRLPHIRLENPKLSRNPCWVMPALKAERTAFTWPRVNVASGMFAFRLWELLSLGGNRFITEFEE